MKRTPIQRPRRSRPQPRLHPLPRPQLDRIRGGIRTGSGVVIELDDDC